MLHSKYPQDLTILTYLYFTITSDLSKIVCLIVWRTDFRTSLVLTTCGAIVVDCSS